MRLPIPTSLPGLQTGSAFSIGYMKALVEWLMA